MLATRKKSQNLAQIIGFRVGSQVLTNSCQLAIVDEKKVINSESRYLVKIQNETSWFLEQQLAHCSWSDQDNFVKLSRKLEALFSNSMLDQEVAFLLRNYFNLSSSILRLVAKNNKILIRFHRLRAWFLVVATLLICSVILNVTLWLT